MRFAAIEGGGTTWVAAITEDEPDNIVNRGEFMTNSDPVITLTAIKEWLLNQLPFDAIGIGSFGPVDVKISSQTYGFITSTPKPGWRNTNVLELLGIRNEFKGIPFLFDTDVNAPALADYLHYTSQSIPTNPIITSSAYITIGTGVGVGLVVNGKTVHGLVHPEGGHILVHQKPDDDYCGHCPFHHNRCVEGMIASGALSDRKGISATQLAELSDDDSIWDVCSYYIAQLCVNLILISSIERIVIGGGIMKRQGLLDKIRKYVIELLNQYIQHELLTTEQIHKLIVASQW